MLHTVRLNQEYEQVRSFCDGKKRREEAEAAMKGTNKRQEKQVSQQASKRKYEEKNDEKVEEKSENFPNDFHLV